MNAITERQIKDDWKRIKPYLNCEFPELKEMCKRCEEWLGEKHDYMECIDRPCFIFFRCYAYLDFSNTFGEGW